MALRNIRTVGDEILAKRAREVKENTPKIQELIDDMLETMYDSDGVGLAAPQVGVLKRIFVIDCSEERNQPFVFINPEIIETSGEQTGAEGCLSVPGKAGIVTRPSHVKVKALNRNFEEYIVEGDELFARALIHENEHLDGHLYTEKVIGNVYNAGDEEAEKAAEIAAGLPVDEEN
ncbi:peptide deformylase [Catonella massiliensis]|jgi:peptide deformylase|uniref:Peptide deformylase n=1 Tax=Catonella massiliensis TaxID=2799636 RepID=A0ABS1J137_9FIRM|nr:peptide deformylase [Catonella massiliensis]MBK5897853.1 peptide deformylase [Catonella massiliensis]